MLGGESSGRRLVEAGVCGEGLEAAAGGCATGSLRLLVMASSPWGH